MIVAQYPPSPSDTPLVPIHTASTGTGDSFEMIVLTIVVLAVVGVLGLLIARRRAG